MWPAISVILLGLIPICSYAFYWWGWNKRNLMTNTYLDQKLKQSDELYWQEKKKNTDNTIRHTRDIKRLLDEAKAYDKIVNDFSKRICELEDENRELKLIRDAQREKLDEYKVKVIPINSISKTLIEESSILNSESLGMVNE